MKSDERFEDLGKAVARLKQMIDTPKSNPARLDALIQRFEFTVELYWKVFKDMLESRGIDIRNPLAAGLARKQGYR